jgi:hypothetical protein
MWHWILAVLIALLLQVFGWIWLKPRDVFARPQRHPPRLTYAANRRDMSTERTPGQQVQSVWSPVLFSLPTSVGFSRSLLTDGANSMRPPLQAPSTSSLFLMRPPRSTVEQPWAVRLPRGARAMAMATPGGPALLAVTQDVFTAAGGERSEGELDITFSGSLNRELFESMSIPEVCRGMESWTIDAHVRVDTRGNVMHVIYNSFPKHAQAALLRQALYKWRAVPADDSRAGRIKIFYHGRPGPAATGGQG